MTRICRRRQSRTVTQDELSAFLAALGSGQAHARSAATIAFEMGLPPTETAKRVVRACAQQAVNDGHLVCSSDRGYFLPATPQEVQASNNRLRAGAYEQLARARRADELAAERFELQDEPDDDPRERPALLALMEA